MHRSAVSSSLVVVACLALGALAPACSGSSSEPAPQVVGSSSGDPITPAPVDTTPPAPTTPTPPAPPKPPEFEWVAPKIATTSAACGAAMPKATGTTYTTPTGRTFHVWGPSNYDPNKTYPIVMMFHGWYANGAAFESWFKMEDYTENEAFVVYPDAINGLWDLNGTTDLLFFDEVVKQLGETYCINPSRILAFGFSYGGRFMSQLGCKRAGYAKAIAIGAAGGGNDGFQCGRVPVLVTGRTADPDELVAWSKTTSDTWSTLNKCAATTVSANPELNCVSHASCKLPGDVTFCEDTFFDASWPKDWNHTVRESYRSFTWKWFKALP